jgi:hypothetical protein
MKHISDVTYLQEKVLPELGVCALGIFLRHISFACLQALSNDARIFVQRVSQAVETAILVVW